MNNQLQLFQTDHCLNKVVNVSQVEKLSPFRYPGGKTWLMPTLLKWMNWLGKQDYFIEPFAGGAIASLTVAKNNLAKKCVMVEKDEDVAAVWNAILYGDYLKLINYIRNFDLNYESAKELIGKEVKSTEKKAFKTIVKNRIFHGGILANGSGFIKNGEKGKGIKSRWYPETIIKRILEIAKIKDKIVFVHGNAFESIKKYQNKKNATFFIDPPYTASKKNAGKRLYKYFEIDHELLFKMTKTMNHFMLTYDKAKEVEDLCAKYSLKHETIPMTGTHNSIRYEMLICDRITWLAGDNR